MTLSTDKYLPSSCSNRGGKINNQLIQSHINPAPPPQLNYALLIQGAKSTLIRFHHLMISIIVLSSIPCSQYIQGLDLKNRIGITHMVQFGRYIRTLRFNLQHFSSSDNE